jgi:hypothetical protein
MYETALVDVFLDLVQKELLQGQLLGRVPFEVGLDHEGDEPVLICAAGASGRPLGRWAGEKTVNRAEEPIRPGGVEIRQGHQFGRLLVGAVLLELGHEFPDQLGKSSCAVRLLHQILCGIKEAPLP